MNTLLLVSNIMLFAGVLLVGFLLLGVLRALGLLSWRLEQLEATTPSRIGRSGLKVGKQAPDFTLPCCSGGERSNDGRRGLRAETHLAERDVYKLRSLHDFAGRKVLLVFTQSGCSPCKAIVPELNRVHGQGEYQVLVINNGDQEATRNWVAETIARFPVLAQEKFSQSKRYEVFATPFAFLIDEKGIIASKGIAGTAQHLGYVLSGAGNRAKHDLGESEPDRGEKSERENSSSIREVSHV